MCVRAGVDARGLDQVSLSDTLPGEADWNNDADEAEALEPRRRVRVHSCSSMRPIRATTWSPRQRGAVTAAPASSGGPDLNQVLWLAVSPGGSALARTGVAPTGAALATRREGQRRGGRGRPSAGGCGSTTSATAVQVEDQRPKRLRRASARQVVNFYSISKECETIVLTETIPEQFPDR